MSDTIRMVNIERLAELSLVLVKRRREALSDVEQARVDEAFGRLGEGTYGVCVECAHEIAGSRLYALAFATRCQRCEDRGERARLQQVAAGESEPAPAAVSRAGRRSAGTC